VAVDGTYSKSRYIASFVGFAPAQHPRLLVAVVVDEPQVGSYYGGTVAAPAFGEIAKFALPYLRIPPDQSGASPSAP
jgi:cell division protein FtsI/penicillin-binding protein 2